MNTEDPTSEEKYIHLIGRALIGTDEEGKFTVTLLDENRQPIEGSIPITFSKLPFELVNMHLVAEFKPAELKTYEATLNDVTHSFAEVGNPNKVFKTCMTSTDPPCSNIVRPPIDPTKLAPHRPGIPEE